MCEVRCAVWGVLKIENLRVFSISRSRAGKQPRTVFHVLLLFDLSVDIRLFQICVAICVSVSEYECVSVYMWKGLKLEFGIWNWNFLFEEHNNNGNNNHQLQQQHNSHWQNRNINNDNCYYNNNNNNGYNEYECWRSGITTILNILLQLQHVSRCVTFHSWHFPRKLFVQ